MKNKKVNPTASKFTVLQQICNLIPAHLVSKLARETGADKKARDFTCWSHVVCLLHAQLSHSIGLNDACDSLQLNAGSLASVAHLQEIHFLWRPFLPDADDDMVLELAFAAGCRHIVTHNVKDFRGSEQLGVIAVSPREFLNLTRKKA